MNRLLSVLLGPARTGLVRFLSGLIAPLVIGLSLNVLQAALNRAGIIVLGTEPAPAEDVGAYTGAQIDEMAHGLALLVGPILTEYQLTILSENALLVLLEEVATRTIALQPPAAT